MKLVTKILAAAAGLMVGTMSQAAIVTQWNAETTGEWLKELGPPPTPTPSTVQVLDGGLRLSWGTGTFGPSSLVITNPEGPEVLKTYEGGGTPPGGFIADSLTLTHYNNPITATTPSSSLSLATLSVSLKLTPTLPVEEAAGQQDLGAFIYHIKFLETPNQTPCADTTPGASICNDIFVLVEGVLNQPWFYEDHWYYINAFPKQEGALKTLDDEVCQAAGAANGCIGFTTRERDDNQLPFGLTISTAPLSVPEPAGLALVGLALAGAGLARRRVTQAV